MNVIDPYSAYVVQDVFLKCNILSQQAFPNLIKNMYIFGVCPLFQIFAGNSNQITVAVNVVNPHILSRYLRIHPRTWVSNIALRIEIFGCFAGNYPFHKIIYFYFQFRDSHSSLFYCKGIKL